MDIFRRKKFNEAMFAKNRTLAIRVGQYQSRDIKEASFDYGYIKGDTYKPGGTCAGSGKITFTSIITTFNKLDKIYPEIGLLVDGIYEWVKMGEYFINDIEIDRNRNTTTLDLMDGMFKLNREYVTDLTYPAEIRHVIKEICLKAGVKLANENMDISSMNYQVEKIPSEKKMTFRDVLSLASQMLGMSCFFNREGKLEIKELTDSGIVITADSYFMHGLTKSEIEYQIAGITCKKDKETLTVGMRTGRSLELDNLFMSQVILDNLYHKIKDIRYYPFNLNFQGHLLLEVGQWVTIKTNKGETFKSPVLSQSFNFKGGLRGRISADSKAGNDAQYSYAGTLTKKIEQFNEFEAQIQNQIEEADKGFDQKVEKIKKDFSNQVELAKAKAEEVKRQLSDTIDQRFDSFNNGPLQEANRKAEEALEKSGANTSLAEEALKIGRMASRRLDALKRDSESMRDITFNTLGEIDREVKKEVKTNSEYRRTTDEMLSRMTGQMNGFATKSEVKQDVAGLTETFAKLQTDTNNLISGANSEITLAKTEFKKTADGLSAKMTAVERYVSQDGQRQEALQRYARDESAKQVTAVRELVTRDYVGKTTYQEDVRGINQRIEEAKRNASNELTTRLANYRQTVDGKFTDISSQVTTYKQVADGQISNLSNRLTTEKQGTDGKIANLTNQVTNNKASSDNQIANLSNQLAKKVEITDFQRVRETSQLYERILGTTEQGLPDKVSRLVMSSSIFQTEVGNFFVSDNNLIVASETLDKYTLTGQRSGVSLGPQNGIFAINAAGLSSFNWSGFTLPIYVPKILKGEVYTLGFKYKIRRQLDHEFCVVIKNHSRNKSVLQKIIANAQTPISSDWQEFQGTFTMTEDFDFGTGNGYPLYFYLVKNGYVEIKEPILVRGSRSSSYKPSQFDDAYKATENAKQLAENAQAKAVQVAEQVNQAQQIAEATRTRVNQLAGSWAVQNINSAGDLISGINLGANGHNRFDGKLTHITGETLIDKAVIKSAMVDKLKTANFEAGSVTTVVLDAEAVTAEKLKVDQAFFNKLVANEAYLNQLFAKQAFINRVKSITIDASQVSAGVLRGASINSLDDSMRIDTNKKEFYLNNNTLFTFFDQKEGMHSFIGTGSRAVNGSGSGIMIGTGLDSASTSQLRNNTSNRDLWSASDGMSSNLLIGSKKNGNGQAWITTNGGIYLSASKSKNRTGAELQLGNILGNGFENKALLTAEDVSISSSKTRIYSSGKMEITGGTGSSLKTSTVTTNNLYLNNKDLVAYFNNLADFVVRIAQNAGWSNVGDYKI
nr:MAG TPA: Neck appendage protein [Caudoviricetes sp.]